jgi:hypothetical protein
MKPCGNGYMHLKIYKLNLPNQFYDMFDILRRILLVLNQILTFQNWLFIYRISFISNWSNFNILNNFSKLGMFVMEFTYALQIFSYKNYHQSIMFSNRARTMKWRKQYIHMIWNKFSSHTKSCIILLTSLSQAW